MSEPIAKPRSDKEIFIEAIELSTPAEREAYLEQACGDNFAVRLRVERLLANHFQQDSFMQEPAVEGNPTAEFTASSAEGPGTIIGRFKLLEELGAGGFGTVYVAEQKEPVKRRVALKIVKLGMDTNQVIARFEAERQALAMMDHPNIAKVLDAGATETGRPYFVMELVRGVPMTQYCDENNLPTIERLKLFIAVCHAIQHAHQKGIIHRDIKPSNILVTLHDGVPVPKVIDFGIAKAIHTELTDKTIYTQFQQFIGTPAYISPEQAEMSGLDIDTRSDIYSLGVLLYELLTGKTPFDAKELIEAGLDEMRRTIREKEPLRPSTRLSGFTFEELTTTARRRSGDAPKLINALRGDLDWIVMKCLEKDRTRRYETAVGVAADLKRYLNNEPVIARPPSNVYRVQKFVRRHKRGVFATGAVALALILGLGVSTFAFVRERDARLKQLAAETERNAETIRADAVGKFMDELLGTTAPELLLQGHQRPVRQLLEAADQFASTGLSNAPAAEFHLRGLMSILYLGDGPSLLDPTACYRQVKRSHELLSRVPDDKLPVSRDEIRIGAARALLWAGHTDEALAEFEALKDEFRRKPSAGWYVAWCLATEGNWHFWTGEAAKAETQLAEALRLTTADTPQAVVCFIRGNLARTRSDRGAWTEAERVAREGLVPKEKMTAESAALHAYMVSELVNALCGQNRFDEAEALVREHRRELGDTKARPRVLLTLEKTLGEVLARAGKPRDALPILIAVATNSLGTAQDCADAAYVAIGSGDLESYRQLCAVGLARFAAGAEGVSALSLSDMLLAEEQNAVIAEVVSDLIERVEIAKDFSKDWAKGMREWLEFRQGQPAELADLWPKAFNSEASAAPIVARVSKTDYGAAIVGFRCALALARLGRFEEAQKAYAEGIRILRPLPSAQQRRDLRESYARWYLAEAHRHEAAEMFTAKGIEIPDSEAQSK